jgi:hypothetical protein
VPGLLKHRSTWPIRRAIVRRAIRIPMFSDQPETQTSRVSATRSLVQSLPGFRGDAPGRTGRDPKSDRPG